MLRENAAHHVLIDACAECQVDLIGNARTAPGWIALFHFDHRANELGIRSLWSRFCSPLRCKQQLILSADHCPMEVQECGRPEGDCHASQTSWLYEERTDAGEHTI